MKTLYTVHRGRIIRREIMHKTAKGWRVRTDEGQCQVFKQHAVRFNTAYHTTDEADAKFQARQTAINERVRLCAELLAVDTALTELGEDPQ